jgi:hypothetical protein
MIIINKHITSNSISSSSSSLDRIIQEQHQQHSSNTLIHQQPPPHTNWILMHPHDQNTGAGGAAGLNHLFTAGADKSTTSSNSSSSSPIPKIFVKF